MLNGMQGNRVDVIDKTYYDTNYTYFDVQYLIQNLPCPLPPRGEEGRAFLLIGWGTARVCLALTTPCTYACLVKYGKHKT